MGMFDFVEGEFKCPNCGCLITDFQTKEHECIMKTYDFRDCDYFYGPCPECDSMVEVGLFEGVRNRIYNEMRRLRETLTSEHYEVYVQTYEERYGDDEEPEERTEEAPDFSEDDEEAC